VPTAVAAPPDGRLRVAFGPVDPAGVGSALAAGLAARGHDARVITWSPSPFGYAHHELVAGWPARIRFAATAWARFDVLHALGGYSWAPFADLALARARRRVALIQFNGSDCRTADVAERLHPARARIVRPELDRMVRRNLRLGGLAAGAAVVQDLELVTYVERSFDTVYVLPLAIDLPAIERARTEAVREPSGVDGGTAGTGQPLRVLHAPSDRRVKGSDLIEAAVAAAARELALELVTVTNRPHEDVLDELARADVVIDQLNAETPGVLALEAMALGKPVLCEYDERKLAGFARPSPAVPIAPGDIAGPLLDLCRDRDRMARLGAAGADYARRLHSPAAAASAAEHVYAHRRGGERGIFEATPEGLRRIDRRDVPGL
jgi:hypothetical protein